MKIKSRGVYITLICILIIAAAIAIACLVKNAGGDSDASESLGSVQDYTGETYNDFEYANGIGGFFSDYDSENEQKVYGLTLPYEEEAVGFKILNIGRYSGEFVEDGSDETISNVLAILVENTGDEMFEFLELAFTDDDGCEYIFDISTLPAGKKCLVMEAGKAIYTDDVNLTLQEITPLYKEDAAIIGDIAFSAEYSNERGYADLTLENNGDRDYNKVYFCYKTFSDDTFIGGITYRVTFDDLKRGASVTNRVSHFYESASSIVLIEEAE